MSTTTSQLKERLKKKQEQLAALEASYDELIKEPIESYTFDSGDGRQQAKRRSLKELQDQISDLEAQIDNICRRLSGKGLTNVVLRRKNRCIY